MPYYIVSRSCCIMLVLFVLWTLVGSRIAYCHDPAPENGMSGWREDAAQSWRMMRDAYSQVEIQHIGSTTFQEGLLEQHVVVKVNGNMFVIEMESFHNGSRMGPGQIRGSNELYGFELSSEEGVGLVLRSVAPTNPTDAVAIPPFAYVTWPFLGLDGVPLEQIVDGTYFDVNSSNWVTSNGDRVFRVEFTRRLEANGADRNSAMSLVDYVGGGWVDLDPSRSWVAVAFEYELLSRPTAQRIECQFEFEGTDDGEIPIVRSFSKRTFDGANGRMLTTSTGTYQKVVFGPIPASEFTVNKFGLETPAIARRAPLLSVGTVFLALLIGVFLAVLGWYVSWSPRRQVN